MQSSMLNSILPMKGRAPMLHDLAEEPPWLESTHERIACSPTFNCLPMGTALSFCTLAVRQSCLLAPVAGVASVAAAAALVPRAPLPLELVLERLLAGCFYTTHKHTSVL